MFTELIEPEIKESALETRLRLHEEIAESRSDYHRKLEKYIIALHEDKMINLEEADARFSTATNINKLRATSVLVIGVGGIGTWIVRMLVGMGVSNITVIDDDIVELHNVGPQSYDISQLGMHKVEALQQSMLQFRGIKIKTHIKRVKYFSDLSNLCGQVPNIVIVAVDNMELRNSLAIEILGATISIPSNIPNLYIDVRMSLGAYNQYMLPVRDFYQIPMDIFDIYSEIYGRETIFEDSEGVQDPCTARAINYTGAAVAANVCAAIHWFNDVIKKDAQWFHKFFNVESDLPFHWMSSFSSRQWRNPNIRRLTKPMIEKLNNYERMVDDLKFARDKIEGMRYELLELKELRQDFEVIESVEWNGITLRNGVTVRLKDIPGGRFTIFEIIKSGDTITLNTDNSVAFPIDLVVGVFING